MVFFRKSEEERPPKADQELVDLRAAVQKARLPESVATVAVKELERLEKTDPSVAEYSDRPQLPGLPDLSALEPGH